MHLSYLTANSFNLYQLLPFTFVLLCFQLSKRQAFQQLTYYELINKIILKKINLVS